MEIPEELKPIFDRYRGKGFFTVGEVNEYVLRWKTIRNARNLNLIDWIRHCSEVSGDNSSDFVDRNIDFWISVWRDAKDGFVHFSRKNLLKFQNERLLEVVMLSAYDYSEGNKEKTDLIFDLVRFN